MTFHYIEATGESPKDCGVTVLKASPVACCGIILEQTSANL
jgi:hypothetical protein